MGKSFYTVEEISQMLSIHPKTVQRYIREGKLYATKIGKAWRVSGHDLSKFTEETSNIFNQSSSKPPIEERTKVSSVIDLTVDGKEDAIRIINTLNAAMNVKPIEFGKTAMHTQFLESESTVRITLWGNIMFMSAIFNAVEVFLEQYEQELK